MSRHILVIANETAASTSLIDKLRERATEGDALVTVIAPVTQPSEGYVVYEDTRRAAAGRRLDRTLDTLRKGHIRANGMVVESDPVAAVKDALAQLEPPVTEIVVSTHPKERSGWIRRNVVERVEKAAGTLPVEHVVAESTGEDAQANVLVVANQTLVSAPLLERIRARARRGPASFLIIAPQGHDYADQPAAERRLRRLISELRAEGIDAHGQIAHPDAHTAAMQSVHDERTDEIIVSTFPGEKSGWLRRDLVQRLRNDTGLPVDHVVSERERVETTA
jgi:selenophosphate synthetase-related protein